MKVDGLGSRVLQLIDARGIQKQMAKLVDLLLDGESDLQREGRALVDSALGLWAQLVKGEAGKADKPEIDKRFVIRGLIEAEAWTVRDSFYSNFKELASGSVVVAEQVFEVLFDQLKTLDELGELKNKKASRTREYFSLLTSLVPVVGENKPDLLTDVLKVAIEASLLHNSTELSVADSTRVGLFNIMASVLSLVKKDDDRRRQALAIAEQAKLIDHIHRDCLFYYGTQDLVPNPGSGAEPTADNAEVSSKRCSTAASRKAAYGVLNEYQGCLEPKEMAEYLQNYINPLLKDVVRPKKWKH